MKAVGLLSGGLDSALAIKLILNENIKVYAFNFITPFYSHSLEKEYWPKRQAEQLGIPIKYSHADEEYLHIVKNPKHGYGRNVNPCIDCRIHMLKKAKEYMKTIGASFIVTGEVVGQRPSSQKKSDLNLIDKESGLEGLVLRPLSAKLLPQTIPEEKGWVKRENLLAIKGRSRKVQMKLAEAIGIKEYATPAGGCLLTEPGFAAKFKDLINYNPNPNFRDIELLKIGRHFRISSAKIVVGREASENKQLESLAQEGDWLFQVEGYTGPIVLAQGELSENSIPQISQITVRYSDAPKKEPIKVKYVTVGKDNQNFTFATAIDDNSLKKIRIG
ncbi:MAG: hypothetical protein QXH91_08585 [Candidatus Bathyarchaeia archaeon]